MWVEGRILDTKGNPIPEAVIETWETDACVHSSSLTLHAPRDVHLPVVLISHFSEMDFTTHSTMIAMVPTAGGVFVLINKGDTHTGRLFP